MAYEDEDVPLNTALTVLADEHRRLVLQYLEETSNGVASRQELIDYMCTHSSGSQDTGQVEIHLHHACLPKLSNAKLIEYDPRSETIRYRSHAIVEDLLDHIDQIGMKRA